MRSPPSQRNGLAWVLAAAVALAYSNCFRNPFILDDLSNILDNPVVRWQVGFGEGLAHLLRIARPVLDLSNWLNFRISGEEVWSYHALNLVIHLGAALLLMAIVRRTLMNRLFEGRFAGAAGPLSFAVALLWALHPLQTAAVTYVIQRSESLMGFFYLLALYGLIRGAESEARGARAWRWLSVFACALGTSTKPVMVTAPIVILLYDRCFLAGSFARALRSRRGYYAGLASSWALFAGLASLAHFDTSAGFSVAGLSPWQYARSEFGVLLHYLRLTLWPHPLVLDYGWPVARRWTAIVPPAVVIVALVALAIRAFLSPRGVARAAGFAGLWFFVILAPSSSVLPIQDLAFEHRMYLSLAAPIALAVVAAAAFVRNRAVAVALLLAAATALGAATFLRNRDYASALGMWADVVAKRPLNARARVCLATELFQRERLAEAKAEIDEAFRIRPVYPYAEVTRAAILGRMGRWEDAAAALEEAVRREPAFAEARSNLANALLQLGRVDEARVHGEEAVRLRPYYAEARNNLGIALARLGRLDAADVQLESAIRLRPDLPQAYFNLAQCRLIENAPERALPLLRRGVALAPEVPAGYLALGQTLADLGRKAEATAAFESALRVDPANEPARRALERLRSP